MKQNRCHRRCMQQKKVCAHLSISTNSETELMTIEMAAGTTLMKGKIKRLIPMKATLFREMMSCKLSCKR